MNTAGHRRISRRRLLRQSAGACALAAAPAFIPASALGRDGAAAPSERLTIGCIGLGGQGLGNMGAFMSQPDTRVVAVCDVSRNSPSCEDRGTGGWEPARRNVDEHYGSTPGTCAVYTDFRELLERDDIDVVSICTPDHWHALIAVAAARSGKDIYCEKPLANSIAEGRAVADAIARYGRVLQTGSHERSRDTVRYACELVRNGYIGQLRTIRINLPVDNPGQRALAPEHPDPVPEGFDYDLWLGPAPQAPYHRKRCFFFFRYVMDYAIGELSDRGAHIIDLAQLGHGSDDSGPVRIEAHGWAPSDGLFNTFMRFQFEMTYADGVRMVGSNDTPRGLRFEGDEGSIFIHIHGGDLEADPPSLLRQRIRPGELELRRSPGHHRDFLDAVRERSTPVAPAETGHRTATVCHLANIAMRVGRPLDWDPVGERIIGDEEASRLLTPTMRSPWTL